MNEKVTTLRVSVDVPVEQVRYLQKVMGIRPKHRSYAPVDSNAKWSGLARALGAHVGGEVEVFELDIPEEPQEARIDLGLFLIEEKGWPASFAARNVDLFAAAVLRRYVRVRGCEPAWDRGHVYRGATDYIIVRDTYDEEIGALLEQVAHEGRAS